VTARERAVTARELALPAIDAYALALGVGDVRAAAPRGSAGAVAALNAALAADLAAQVARNSPRWRDRGGTIAQADMIRQRSIGLAARVEDTFEAALDALERVRRRSSGHSGDPDELGRCLGDLMDLLLGVGDAANDAAGLAELAARSGEPVMVATAVSAAIVAASAADVVVHLIEVNLLSAADDERLRQARELAATANTTRDRARRLVD
jgi:formiminotetrahydrofolate cyclodeaminase